MKICEYLKILDSEYGVSGNENAIRLCVKSLFEKYCSSVYTDTLGNVIGIKKGRNEKSPSLMIEAHMDEIGLMVSEITNDGSLKFVPVGGFDPKIFPGCEVTVWGQEKLFGVIGAKPPHLRTAEDNPFAVSDMCIDIGFFSKEHAEKKVSVGDIITFNTQYTPLDSNMAAARCIDDRGGIATIMRVLEMLSSYELDNDIIAVATVQEEVGLRGAKTAAAHILPDCAIAIDVCHATSPTVSDEAYPCGKGPVVTIGPNLHSKMTRQLISLAERDNIDIQLEVCGGDTGTDAWEIQVAGDGIPTALISIPVRYMHTNYEVANLQDMENAARLIATFAAMLKGGECLCW